VRSIKMFLTAGAIRSREQTKQILADAANGWFQKGRVFMCHKDHPLAALGPISWPESTPKDRPEPAFLRCGIVNCDHPMAVTASSGSIRWPELQGRGFSKDIDQCFVFMTLSTWNRPQEQCSSMAVG
jgi:hypothetical protein